MRFIACVLALVWCSVAAAEVRVGGSAHATARSYGSSSNEDHDGMGPGLGVHLLAARTGFAHGFRLAWHTYGEEDALGPPSRFHVVELQYYAERRFDGGFVGAGIGLDVVRAQHYSSDGAPSYTSRDTMIALGVQLGVDIASFDSGDRLSLTLGLGVFPLVDVLAVVSNGEADIGWRGITGSLGIAWTR